MSIVDGFAIRRHAQARAGLGCCWDGGWWECSLLLLLLFAAETAVAVWGCVCGVVGAVAVEGEHA